MQNSKDDVFKLLLVVKQVQPHKWRKKKFFYVNCIPVSLGKYTGTSSMW